MGGVSTQSVGTISIKSFPAEAGPTKGDVCSKWDRL
jgi:hypothetical protein